MTTRHDPLVVQRESPDRLFFATGVLLDAQDLEAEQRYHRGRLARALAYTYGVGTVAGLRVVWVPAAGQREERVLVEPGMAIDRVGRIVEVPRTQCTRLQRWLDARSDDELDEAVRDPIIFTPDQVTRDADGRPTAIRAGTVDAALTAIVVDVFLRFVTCERGKTPAFATGPFDALDAVQPSRLRDGYELSLVPRRIGLPLPESPLPDLDGAATPDARRRRLEEHVFRAWRETDQFWSDRGLKEGDEHVEGQDPTSIFLARLAIPATRTGSERPSRVAGAEVRVDNHSRQFVHTPSALARALGAL